MVTLNEQIKLGDRVRLPHDLDLADDPIIGIVERIFWQGDGRHHRQLYTIVYDNGRYRTNVTKKRIELWRNESEQTN